MALLVPLKSYTGGNNWHPSTATYEPAGYAQLGRFWWNPYDAFKYYPHFHPGIDLHAPLGTPIAASEVGIIIAIGYNGSSGLRYNVQIRPGTIYVGGHMNDVASKPGAGRDWRVGDKILRGQVIGTVGHSGIATGDHVHFGVQSKVPGTSQSMIYDPRLFFPGGANQYDARIKPYY
jgi:murein DD-endopeptidase MepM/ murein hydrolase activator NlpD